jgi:hypothetical protein
MQKKLPARPSLAHLKAQAKELLHAAKNTDTEALKRFRALPAFHGKSDARILAAGLALHDAQSVIAREYGFPSFVELRARVLAQENVHTLMQRHMAVPPPAEVLEALHQAAQRDVVPLPALDVPKPVLAVRNALLTRGAVAPFQIARPASVAAIQVALAGDHTLVVFAQRNETTDSPTRDELHDVGCIAHVSAFFPEGERGSWLVVKALAWVRLEALVQDTPYLSARVSELTIVEDDPEVSTRLGTTLLDEVRPLGGGLPLDDLTPVELADATVANLYCSVEDKARYAALPSATERLRFALELLRMSEAPG